MIVTYGTSILQATMYKIILVSVSLLVLTTVALIGSWFWVMYNYGRSLPDYKQLEKYEPAVMTRVHAGDGRLFNRSFHLHDNRLSQGRNPQHAGRMGVETGPDAVPSGRDREVSACHVLPERRGRNPVRGRGQVHAQVAQRRHL